MDYIPIITVIILIFAFRIDKNTKTKKLLLPVKEKYYQKVGM